MEKADALLVSQKVGYEDVWDLRNVGDALETSYGKSTLNSLKNTENFTESAIEHIFEGQVNARGKAVGYHYEGIEGTSGNVIPGTESSVNNIGVYKAQVEVNGIPKTANGGFSTFYSKNLSPQQVVDAINEAYSNCELKLGTRNTYQGVANNGMKIDMCFLISISKRWHDSGLPFRTPLFTFHKPFIIFFISQMTDFSTHLTGITISGSASFSAGTTLRF